MENIFIIVFWLIGAVLGYIIPDISQEIVLYKCNKKNIIFASSSHYMSTLPRIVLSVLNGILWALSCLFIENIAVAILFSLIFTIAILISIIDIEVRIIPNEILLIMIAAGIGFQSAQFGFRAFLISILCMFAMIIFFTSVASIVGLDKVGAGDVKLAGTMGMVLGYPNIMMALIIMSVAFLIYSLGGLIMKTLDLKSTLPFAPFMMVGMVFALGGIMF